LHSAREASEDPEQTPDPRAESLVRRVERISRWTYAVLGALVFLGDQSTKALVVDALPEHAIVPVIPHFLNFTHVSNAGAAFGLFSDSPSRWKTALLVIVSTALLAAVVSFVYRSRRLQWESGVGLALILGGAFSNLFDRIRNGRVVDFLDFYVRNYHWYTFNLADSAIVVGAAFLIVQVIISD
jgi:signal peptidase II